MNNEVNPWLTADKHTTHFACDEMLAKYGGKTIGCCCTGHECKEKAEHPTAEEGGALGSITESYLYDLAADKNDYDKFILELRKAVRFNVEVGKFETELTALEAIVDFRERRKLISYVEKRTAFLRKTLKGLLNPKGEDNAQQKGE